MLDQAVGAGQRAQCREQGEAQQYKVRHSEACRRATQLSLKNNKYEEKEVEAMSSHEAFYGT